MVGYNCFVLAQYDMQLGLAKGLVGTTVPVVQGLNGVSLEVCHHRQMWSRYLEWV